MIARVCGFARGEAECKTTNKCNVKVSTRQQSAYTYSPSCMSNKDEANISAKVA